MNRSRPPQGDATTSPHPHREEADDLSVEAVCAKYAGTSVKICVDDIDGQLVLLRGSSSALLFLAELLRAHALSGDTGFHLSPKGAGASLFSDESKYGIYLLRTEERQTLVPSTTRPRGPRK